MFKNLFVYFQYSSFYGLQVQSNLRFNESIVPTQKFVETRKFAEANLVMIDKKIFY